MTTAPSNITGYESRHSDGTPGLEYFSHEVAFAWSGRLDDPIEVSLGAYGEAVDYLIDARAALQTPKGLGEALAWFASVCDEWLTWADEHDGAAIPVRSEFDTASSASRQHYIETGIWMLRPAEKTN